MFREKKSPEALECTTPKAGSKMKDQDQLIEQSKQNPAAYGKYIALGLLMFAIGLAGGAYYGVIGGFSPDLAKDKSAATVQGEQADNFTGRENLGQDIQVSPEDISVENKIATPTSPPPPSPQPSAAKGRASVVEKVSVCEQAKDERVKAETQAQSVYDADSAAAKKIFDTQMQEINIEFTDLARKRNEAINNYLTAIAIATSKYNSSTASDAYQIYQQEQATGLTAYTQKISEISTQEALLAEQKQTAQKFYEDALAALKTKLETDRAVAQSNYETKTVGQNCA